MFETNIVVVGNVLTAPEWRKISTNGTLVASFRVASTARRLDRDTGRWIDGDSLRLRVNCWRKLAEGVCASVAVGDPVIVTGRVFSRDWTDSEGNTRLSYEMEAVAVGHDLARGRARFVRNRATTVDAATGPEADTVVRGEAAEVVPEDEVPVGYGDGIPEVGDESTFDPPAGDPPVTGLDGLAGDDSGWGAGERSRPESGPGGAERSGGGAGVLARREDGDRSHGEGDGELEIQVEALTEETDTRRRPRRATRRQPVPA